MAEWWTLLHAEIRSWIAKNLRSPLATYSLEEITWLGGPGHDDPFWDHRDGEVYLPTEAVTWIINSPDFERLKMPKEPDPRAAYFRRGWP